MSDCLVTKLKGSVGDSSLPILGGFEMEIKANAGYVEFLSTGCTFKRYDSDGNLVQTTINNFTGMNFAAGKLRVENKYAITKISAAAWDTAKLELDEISPCTLLTYLSAYVSGDLSSVSGLTLLTNLTLIVANGGTLSGDLSVLSLLTSLASIFIGQNTSVVGNVSVFSGRALTGVTLQSPGIVGDVASFGKSIGASDLWLNGSGISGAIEDLADAQVTNGRTSGTLIIHGNGLMTYNGAAFSGNKTITFSGGSYIIS